jgi:hypothetical protein
MPFVENAGGGGGGSGTVTEVTSADTSIVVTNGTTTPSLQVATLDVIATNEPAAAAVDVNGQKITSLADGSASDDAAAFGQLPFVDVTDGTHTVTSITQVDFTSGATVTDGGGGVAQVAISAGGATVPVPVNLTNPDAAGNGYANVLSTANIRVLIPAFLKDVVGDWWGTVRVPDNYSSAGAITFAIAANATSGVTTMGLASNPVANTEDFDAALTSETDQDITVPGTAYDRKDVTFTLTPTLAAGDLLLVRIRHNGTATNDTLAADTLMFDAVFSYTAA